MSVRRFPELRWRRRPFSPLRNTSNRDSLSFGPAGLAHVHRVQFALKTLFVAFPAFNHRRSIGMRRHADEKAFMRPEDRLDAVRMNIGLQLRINHFRSQ